MKKQLLTLLLCGGSFAFAQQPVDYVNPFIGTSNFGTTNPGAVCPQGMMSVTPFMSWGQEPTSLIKTVGGGQHPIHPTMTSSPVMLTLI